MTSPDAIDYRTIRKQLARFSCLDTAPALGEDERAAIREALLIFNDASDYQTLGVCAETMTAGKTAMEAYVAALSRPIQLPLEARRGPIYLKFNTLKGAWYLEDYSGSNRGVLVSFHASEPDADPVNGTYGPFPLDLFDR